ncbi:P-loop containing nucleoside triphosphate hydrolase protein [Ganoderma leucocontextum]|nr:P-loop containing nucleoside triphosphate hydrolase protein [Ganoderma leucocontextum]
MAPLISSNFCPNVLYGGGCNDASCLGQHDVRLCELCVVICSPATNFNSHIRGSQHLTNAANAAPLRVLNAQLIRCPPCSVTVTATQWGTHITGDSHRKHQELASLRAAYELAESDKQGVSVSHLDTGIDFGAVGLDEATAGARQEVCLSSEKHVTLVRTWVRARIPNHASLFKAICRSNTTLAPGSEVRIPILFRHGERGRYEARLEFTFQGLAGREFVIARRLLAQVGESAERELLKPVTPFVRSRYVRWDNNDKVLAGDAPPKILPIKWARDLLPFTIPPALAEILKTGTHPEIFARLSQEYFPEPLSLDNFQTFFSLLLWIEEARMVDDLRMYDMRDVQFAKDGRLYSLHVYGLAEGRPSVTIGDTILVQEAGVGRTFKGVVHDIRQEEILVSFHPDFPGGAGRPFNVRFQLNRTPLRRQHQAIVATIRSPRRLLFPELGDEGLEIPVTGADSHLALFNSSIGTNIPQLAAVMSIVQLRPGSAPFILFGPPGTGKTVTLVETIYQLLLAYPDARILACAPSNSAADIIAQRLITLSPEEMFRCNAAMRNPASVPPELVPYCYRPGNLYSLPPMDTLMRFRVIVSTCNNASFGYNIGLPAGHFTHIFVDEAGQASEPEMLVAVKPLAVDATRIILSGDPKQLGPVIRSSMAREFGMEKSYLERLMDRPLYSSEHGRGRSFVKLVKNYRSHEAILRYPNEKFYDNELEVCGSGATINGFLNSTQLVSPTFPVVFHAISGTNDREASSPSYFNVDEALQVKAYVTSLLQDRQVPLQARDIGVIAPYHAQVRKIRQLLRSANFVDVKVGSVEEFQGQERRVIIVSTVRSSTDLLAYDAKFALGFLSNARRFNVAMTRAQALLIVVGDAAILSVDPLWRGFMNYVHTNNGWRGDAPTWNVDAPVVEDADYADELREAIAADMNAVMAQLPPEEDIEAEANVDRSFWESGGDANEW